MQYILSDWSSIAIYGVPAVMILTVFALYWASFLARKDAVSAVNDWAGEVDSANSGLDRRYNTPMPDDERYKNELYCSQELLKQVIQDLEQVLQAPLPERLGSNWRKRCRAIQSRARKGLHDLQDEAFWAQFEPGSPIAEARFKETRAGDSEIQ